MESIIGVAPKEIEKEILLSINERAYNAGIIDYEIYIKTKADIEKL